MNKFLFTLLTLSLTSLIATAKDPINQNRRGLAIKGYDVVAYFEAGQPTEGKKEFTYEHKDATWRFSSPENLDSFKSNPDRYIPQYGGYCAWAVSQGYTAGVDPKAWKIVEGKLYLNYNAKIQKKWEADIPGFIEAANQHWPKVLTK